jgi:hypothetical protein
MPSMVNVEEAAPAYDVPNEVIEIPFGFMAEICRMTEDKGGSEKDEMTVTSDPVEERLAVMVEISVPVPPPAVLACSTIAFSAILEMRYDGKRKTDAIKMASEIKKRKTIKNLMWYSVLRSLTVFGGRRAWYMVLI